MDNSPVCLLTVPKSPACHVVGEWVKRSDDAIAMTNIDLPGGVPIRPLCGRLLDQIDVLALRILFCAEEDHCELWGMYVCVKGQGLWSDGLYVEQSTNQCPALLMA